MKELVRFLIVLYVSQHALCVEVFEGEESVVLPCQVNASVSEKSTVVWSREDIKTSMVHARRQSGDVLADQDPRYEDRTSMRTHALQTGDLDLILRKPTTLDSGNYTCTVREFGQDLNRTQVPLTVREPRPDPKVVIGVVVPLVLLVLLVLAAGVFIYRRRKDRGVQQVEVDSGAESVQLPFNTTGDLPEDVQVEWTDSDKKIVHVYQNSSDRPKDQDHVYRDRTEMKEDLLRTGDLSLTLKHPTVRDTGKYTCSVYNREGKVLKRRQVELKVKVQQVEVDSGAESVQLPFSTTGDLPEDVQVLWWRDEPKPPMKIHVYQRGSVRPQEQHQIYRDRTEMKEDLLRTGDLSLTLKQPRDRDTGTYVCRVFNRDACFLREKTVLLKVKEGKGETFDIRNRSSFTDPIPLMADQSAEGADGQRQDFNLESPAGF